MMEYKGFRLRKDGQFGMYRIGPLGSGATPASLSGAYTKESAAKTAIDNYKPKRGAKKHGQTESTVNV